MNRQEWYERWIQKGREPVCRPDFVDQVMKRVHQTSPPEPRPLPTTERILSWVGLHPMLQVAAILLALVVTIANSMFLLRIGIG